MKKGKKGLKIIVLVFVCFLGLGLLIGGMLMMILGNEAKAEEYTLGNDTIQSIGAVVGKRSVTSISIENSVGVKTKTVHYRSDAVQSDLMEYVQYLREEAGFQLTSDMDLAQIPATVQLGKQSEDPGDILILTIDYGMSGYTITLQKGSGTLTHSNLGGRG